MSPCLQIAVSGKGTPDDDLAPLAEDIGRRLAEAGATVVCGGMGGVMEAASRGARAAGGDVIGIVPGEDAATANPYVTHAVASGIGHARNLAVVASGDAVIAIGGEWGTLSEIAFARRLDRPVITLRSWPLRNRAGSDLGIVEAETPEAAVEAAFSSVAAAGSG